MGTTTIVYDDKSLSAVALRYSNSPELMKERTYAGIEYADKNKVSVANGEYFVQRFIVDDHIALPTPLTNGYEPIELTAREIYKPAVQQPIFLVYPVMISGIDEAKYGGAGAMVDQLKDRVRTVVLKRRSDHQRALFQGPSASSGYTGVFGWAGLPTLNGIDFTDGFLENRVSGTNTLHALTKATYPVTSHARFHNFWRSCNDAFGVFGLNAMHGAKISQELTVGPINNTEQAWFAGANPAEFLKQTLRPLERYVGQKELDDGERRGLMFAGALLHPIIDMPTSGTTTSGTPASIMGVNFKKSVRCNVYNGWTGDMTYPMARVPDSAGVRVGMFGWGGTEMGNQMVYCTLLTDGEQF